LTVEAELSSMPHPKRQAVDRLAATFLLVVLIVGCLFLWIGIPVVGLWLLGKLVESSTNHFVIGLIGVPAAMALFAPFLFWVNGLYLRVTGAWVPRDEVEDEEEWRPPRGPLEPLLVWSFLIALALLVLWFFFVAQNPPRQVI